MAAYQRKPCRGCGGVIPTGAYGLRCEPCHLKQVAKYRQGPCGVLSPDHIRQYCDECRRLDKAMRSAAALRGAEKRQARRPQHADRYWSGSAHSAVSRAIKRGLLPKLDGTYKCADCDQPAVEYDHRDYGRPLEVEPVCRSCNKRRGAARWPKAEDYNFERMPARKRRAA